MTEIQIIDPAIPGNRILGFTAFLFEGVAYLTFPFTILYGIGIVAFWAAPVMSAGHLLFAAVATACIFVDIKRGERALIDMFGDRYHRYRERAPMLFPWHKLT